MADNIVGDIAGANNELSKMKRLIGDIGVAAKKAFAPMAKDVKAVGNGGFGNRGYGVGQTPNVMSQSFGSFSAFMPPTGNVGATVQWSNRMGMGMSAAQGGLRAATGAVVGGFMAMPDVAMTVGRASAFYGANLLQGATPGGRNAITNATFSGMRGGISGLGQDAATAGILSGLGVSTNSAQFGNLLTSTKNAARYLNIDNVTAAQALGGLTSGATSQALMRNFGMYTTDPITGRRLQPTEIFEQLNARMTAGQKLSVEELKTSYQGGALASNLANSGLDPAQQRLAYQYMLDKAAGKKMDLGDDALMARLQKSAGINPDQASYDANTAQTGTMNAATDAYIEGMKKAVVVIEQFNKTMQGFLKSPAGNAMAQLTAGTDLAMKDPTIAGGVTGIGMALGGAGQLIGGIAGGMMLSRFLKGKGILGGGAGGAAAGVGAKLPKGWKMGKNDTIMKPNSKGTGFVKASKADIDNLAKKGPGALSKGLGKAVPVLGTAMAGFSIFDNISKGNWRGVAGDVGGLIGGFGLAAGVAAGTGGTGLLASTALYAGGSYAGSIGGEWLYDQAASMFGGGGGGPNPLGAGSNSATGAGAATFKLIHPVGKAKMVCGYGVVDKLHPDGHFAVDWAATEGFGIMAAADGKVTEVGGNSRNTMGTSDRSYGLRVRIDHGNGYSTLYAHLSGFDVSTGQTVKQGQQIGRVGNTGYSEAPHLHFELWQGGKRIDPSPFLGANYAANSGVAGVGTSNSARNGMAGSADAGLLGFSSGAAGNGLKIPNAYSGAAIGKSSMGGGGRTSASSGGDGQFAGKGAGGMSTGLGGSIGTTGSGDGPGGGGGGNNFVINVNVASASESEARRFAKLIQEYLDNDTLTSSMGRL
ncbi:Peptidase M23 [uncultured Caudovirales phage]|uniref:Peptidase M23 n=1 Tax=uncultured Caudovirales phage TaxID=2100421 RepID=A0A6J5MSX3_9CAUD|nr:Peptidase M23 [uncultured Caudovirales phage]CAB4148126.1 Peptidase M23 [uncultured Caudovirales phage]